MPSQFAPLRQESCHSLTNHTPVDDADLPIPTLRDLLTYRKAAMAVMGTYLGLEDGFIEAILIDQMDEWLCEQAAARDALRREHYEDYLALLGREITVRYAATAAEGLVADPGSTLATERIMGDTGGLGLVDNANAFARIHEIFEALECPDASEDAEKILQHVKLQLCNYYNACAYSLVKGQLLPVIIDAAEELYTKGTMTPLRVKEMVIAEQEK